jgi:hypothetical protein
MSAIGKLLDYLPALTTNNYDVEFAVLIYARLGTLVQQDAAVRSSMGWHWSWGTGFCPVSNARVYQLNGLSYVVRLVSIPYPTTECC